MVAPFTRRLDNLPGRRGHETPHRRDQPLLGQQGVLDAHIAHVKEIDDPHLPCEIAHLL